MSKPCQHCPFRSDRDFWLNPDRRKEIAEGVLNDAKFPCHETTTFGDEGQLIDRRKERFCIGAALFIENVTGSMFSNLAVRIAAMGKQLDPSNIDRSIPVFESAEEFIGGNP